VTYTALTLTTQDGGTTILGYDLWRDDGSSGDFTQLFATDTILGTTFTDISVSTGLLYRYKYRGRNTNGYGEFSDVGYLYAASVAGKPNAPSLIAVDTTTIQLKMSVPEDSGGTEITAYQLFVDAGTVNTDFTEVASFKTAGGETASLL
jgi:hypothetical protein